MSHFKGKDALLLQDYFDLKVKLGELQTKQRFWKDDEELELEIQEVEKNIIEIISMFDKLQLRQIIFMGLNIDYDDLVDKGIIR